MGALTTSWAILPWDVSLCWCDFVVVQEAAAALSLEVGAGGGRSLLQARASHKEREQERERKRKVKEKAGVYGPVEFKVSRFV